MIKASSFLLVLVAGFFVACGGSSSVVSESDPPPPQDTNQRPAANANEKPNRVFLRWSAGWVIKIRPFFSGQLLKDGIGTVIVEEWDNGPEKLSYAFPRDEFLRNQKEVFDASRGALRHEATAGTISVDSKSRAASVFTPPAFWPGGTSSAPGPVLWLPASVLSDLKTKKEAQITLEPLPQGLLMATVPGAVGGATTLKLVNSDLLGLLVNGQRLWLPIVKATDDRGSEYVILDSNEGALVMRFKMGPNVEVSGKRLKTASNSGYDVMSLDNRDVDVTPAK